MALTKKQQERKDFLITNHWAVWSKEREKQWEELSDKHPLLCVCGKLCTGLHENYCRKFQEQIDRNTLKSLKDFKPIDSEEMK